MNYVYCYESTCDAAAKACKKFTSLGYKVKEIKGGFEQWQEYKYLWRNKNLLRGTAKNS